MMMMTTTKTTTRQRGRVGEGEVTTRLEGERLRVDGRNLEGGGEGGGWVEQKQLEAVKDLLALENIIYCSAQLNVLPAVVNVALCH